MSNQDLNELKSINNQLEQLQNQKRIIQQKLQDENDMMMVENHLFSQSEIQELIQEIEKDFPDFKINIDYKANNLTFIHKEHTSSITSIIMENIMVAFLFQTDMYSLHQALQKTIFIST